MRQSRWRSRKRTRRSFWFTLLEGEDIQLYASKVLGELSLITPSKRGEKERHLHVKSHNSEENLLNSKFPSPHILFPEKLPNQTLKDGVLIQRSYMLKEDRSRIPFGDQPFISEKQLRWAPKLGGVESLRISNMGQTVLARLMEVHIWHQLASSMALWG